MKKKIIVSISLILVLIIGFALIANATDLLNIAKTDFFSSVIPKQRSSDIVAIVNGENIYQNEIDYRIAFNEIQRINTPDEYKDSIPSITEEDALNTLIKNRIIQQEAQKIGVIIDKNGAREYIENNYNEIMKLNDENAMFLKEYLQNTNLSEEEYLELATGAYCNILMRNGVYANFCIGKTGTDEELLEQFDLYVDDLVSLADVEIITK